MKPICDYHIHTELCGHARGEVSQYAQKAIDVGLKEIGFSDHAPLLTHEDSRLSMTMEQLPDYHKMIEKVQKDFKGQLDIKIGIEADYVEGYEERMQELLTVYPYDYVIGSVHCIDRWMFDHPDYKHLWEEKNVDQVYKDYYATLRKCADSKLFDIIGHADLVKKFGYRPKNDLSLEIELTAEKFKKNGLIIEINTSGLRKPVEEIYPSLSDLRIYCQKEVPITFGSDAHTPHEVGKDFDLAVKLALEAGYCEYVTLKSRKIQSIEKL